MESVLTPGDILIERLGFSKARPWVVLWVDDVARCACVIALTTQGHFGGCVRIDDPAILGGGSYGASWVMVIQLDGLSSLHTRIRGRISPENLRKLESNAARYLGLRP